MRGVIARANCGVFAAMRCTDWRSLPSANAPALRLAQQLSPEHVQIRQRTGHLQAVQVLRHSSIADLGETEDAFDDQEGVLDFGAYLRLVAILAPLLGTEILIAATAALGEVTRMARFAVYQSSLSRISTVPVNTAFAAMQQARQRRLVVNVGRARNHRVNQLAAAIDPDCVPSSQSTLDFLSWFDASRGLACRSGSWSNSAH